VISQRFSPIRAGIPLSSIATRWPRAHSAPSGVDELEELLDEATRSDPHLRAGPAREGSRPFFPDDPELVHFGAFPARVLNLRAPKIGLHTYRTLEIVQVHVKRKAPISGASASGCFRLSALLHKCSIALRALRGIDHLSDCANTSSGSSCACHGPGGVVAEQALELARTHAAVIGGACRRDRRRFSAWVEVDAWHRLAGGGPSAYGRCSGIFGSGA
jgi:hypothetical protein